MDLRAIKVFVLAAKSLNFTRVAELLYISPSSVSKYIAQLEGEVGKPLFARDTRKVELSEYGQALLPYAEELWLKDQDMERFISMHFGQEEMNTVAFGLSKEIRVNPPIEKFDKILKAFSKFRTERPNSFMTLRYMPEGDLAKAVVSGTIQAALVWGRYFMDNADYADKISYLKVMREKRYLMFSPRQFTHVQSVEDLRWTVDKIIYAENIQSGQSAHTLTRHYFCNAEACPCDTWSEEFLRVIAEEGVGFIEESLVELAESVGLRCLPLDQQDDGCHLCIIWRNGCSRPDVLRLVELLDHAFSDPDFRIESDCL